MRRGHSSRVRRAAWASGRAPSVVGGRTGGCEPGRVDDAALHSTATVRYESTAAPRFGAASIRILTPAGTGGSTALTDGRRAQLSCTGGAANIRTNPGGEGTGGRLTDSCSVLLSGRLTDSCSVLLSRAQTRRTKALVGARETICPDPGRGTNQDAPANTARLNVPTRPCLLVFCTMLFRSPPLRVVTF